MRFIFILTVLLFNINYLNTQSKPETKTKDPPPLVLNISQKTIYAIKGEAYIHFLITVERHPDNRSLTLEFDCPTSYGSTLKNLNGEKAPRIFNSYEIGRNMYLTEGTCIITLILHRNDGKDILIRKEIDVISYIN